MSSISKISFSKVKLGSFLPVEGLEHFFDKNGLDALDPFYIKEYHPGNFSKPRKYEIAAAINRLRTLKQKTSFNK